MTVTNSEIGAYVDSLSDIGTPASGDELLIYDVSATTTKKVQASALTGGGGGSGALVFLEAHTASASATLDFTTFISSTYDEYAIEIVGITPASNATELWMRMGTGAGPTFDSGSNYDGAGRRDAPGGQAGGVSSGGAQLVLSASGSIGNASTRSANGNFRLYSPQSTALHKQVQGQMTIIDSTGTVVLIAFAGVYKSTTAVTGVQFLMSSGNIASGTIRIYGVAKS